MAGGEAKDAGSKQGMLDAISGMSGWKKAGLLFAGAFAARIALDLLFLLQYGWHAVNQVETWFYYGVAKGTHYPAEGILDPTVWILSPGGMLLSGELPLYYVVFLSAVLSSLTAVAIYLLAREHSDDKTAFFAGAIYAFMVQPLALSLMGFTHDHLQLLVFVLTIYCAVKVVKAKGVWKAPYAVAFLLLVYNGLHINPVIKIAVGVSLVYVATELVRQNVRARTYDKYFAVLVACIAVGGLLLLPAFIESSLEFMPQGRTGSVDLAPITVSNFWLRYNVLLMLLPFALLAGYERKDVAGLSLAILGIILSTVMDRGARILDLGVAMLAAPLLFGWNGRYNRYFIGLSVLAFAFFLTQTSTSIVYGMLFLAAGACLASITLNLGGVRRAEAMLAVIMLLGAATNIAYVYTADARKITPEAEYEMFKWLQKEGPKGKILVGWDHGYFLQALTGLSPVSTPNRIEYYVHDYLWLPEQVASLQLGRAGVDYVMISDKNFNIVKSDVGYSFALSGGLVLEPEKMPKFDKIQGTAVYKLRNEETSMEYFVKVKEIEDDATGVKFMLYKVVEE